MLQKVLEQSFQSRYKALHFIQSARMTAVQFPLDSAYVRVKSYRAYLSVMHIIHIEIIWQLSSIAVDMRRTIINQHIDRQFRRKRFYIYLITEAITQRIHNNVKMNPNDAIY